MKTQQRPISQEKLDVLELVDNTNKKYSVGKHDYLLLIKRQKEKDYATLYITDCDSTFWIKKIDKDFFEQLKNKMSINTELKVFCNHFVKNLKEKSKLKVEGGQITVQIELVIGEGLVMACTFDVQTVIRHQQSPGNYKKLMQMFLKQLYEAKDAQIDEQRKKWEKFKQIQEDKRFKNHEKVDPTYVKQVLNASMKKSAGLDVKIKNRSLMNPNQKKRKPGGIKFTGDQ